MPDTVFSIGYEGASVDDITAALQRAGVTLLADVRAVAASRKKGMSKTALAAHLKEAGIDYVHYRALGTPKEGRDAARRGDHATLHSVYDDHLATEEAQHALDLLIEEARAQPTCLLCFEREPGDCHRDIVAMRMEGFAHEALRP